MTSNNPLAQPNDASETSAPAGAPPPVLPSGAVVVTVGSVPLDPQVLDAQRKAALDPVIQEQVAIMDARNAQIKQLNDELQKAQVAGDTATVEKLKTEIDTLSNQAQLDQIKLQSMMNRAGAAFDAASKLASNVSAARDQIARNIK